MSYVVLARKWRPQSFDDLVGQEHIATTLANAIAQNRVAHAFLFTGVRGVGKTTSARILAKALNCEKGPTAKPCLTCSACVEITEGRDMDVQEIDGATYNGVDDIRELQEKLPYRPARDRYKIFIVDEVHMLSKPAWNAFLKTLEEPPPHVKFIFATTEVDKVLVTILSRCQRYDFRLISAARIAARLRHVLDVEKIAADDEALAILAREAAGSMRDAMSLLDQVIAWAGPSGEGEGGAKLTREGVSKVLGVVGREELHALASALVEADAARALRSVDDLARQGYDMVHLAKDLLHHLRNLVVARVASTDDVLLEVPDAERAALRELASKASPEDLCRLHQGLSKAFDDFAESPDPRAGLEMTLVRLATRPALVPLDDLLKRLGELEQRLGGGRSGGGGGGGRAGAGGQRPAGGAGAGGPPPARASAEPAPSFSAPVEPGPTAPVFTPPPRPDAAFAAPAPRQEASPRFVAPPPRPEPPPTPMFVAPPPRPEPPPSAPPPTMPPPSAPPPIHVDRSDPKILRFARVTEALRATSGALASILERAHIAEANAEVVRIALDPRGFEKDQLAPPAARQAVESAVAAALGADVRFEVVDAAPNTPRFSLSVAIESVRREKVAELDQLARNHPLVLGAQRELGAEIREVRLPEVDVSTAFAASP
ncbi:MAG: DNA polymerase III subunit gamma/tau [Polyangiaceae bacterium]